MIEFLWMLKTSEKYKTKFVNNILRILIIVIFLLSMTNIYAAQINSANFSYPANNQTEVPLIPQIMVSTGWKIDSSSITFIYPNLDSNIHNNIDLPTLMILPDIIYDSLNNDMRKVFRIKF